MDHVSAWTGTLRSIVAHNNGDTTPFVPQKLVKLEDMISHGLLLFCGFVKPTFSHKDLQIDLENMSSHQQKTARGKRQLLPECKMSS